MAQSYLNNFPPYVPPETPVDPSFGTTVEPPVGTTDMTTNTLDQFGRPVNSVGMPISNGAPSPIKPATLMSDPMQWAKDNPKTAMLGGLGLAGAMGAFKPNTLNTPPKTASFYETTYNAPKFVTDPTTGRVTYVAGSQGYGPGTRVTRNVATGGGIRALSGGGETAPFVSMPSRGQKPANQKSPRSPEDS